MSRKAAAACLLVAVAWLGCTGGRAGPADSETPAVLVYGLETELQGSDVVAGGGRLIPSSALAARMILEPLLRLSPEGSWVPALCTQAVPEADGRSWTFSLRRDVVFHDGTAFSAEAVVRHWQRLLDPDIGFRGRLLIEPVEAFRRIDDHTVRFDLRHPWPVFLSVLADPMSLVSAIPSPAQIEADRQHRGRAAGRGAGQPAPNGLVHDAGHTHLGPFGGGVLHGRAGAGNPTGSLGAGERLRSGFRPSQKRRRWGRMEELMHTDDRASQTARGIAAARARESARPAGERLFHDPFAWHFLSRPLRFMAAVPPLRAFLRRRNARSLPGMFGGLVIRTRYMDDHLLKCLDNGVRQVVILGAGYDARPYRFRDRSPGVRYFEVDRPATLAVKTTTMERLLGSLPEHVTYVPVRFHRERLEDKLTEAGYRPDRTALFIWEGVTMYLESSAIDATLRFVAHSAPPESSLIFDYFPPSVAEGTCERTEAKTLTRRLARCGERIRWGARPEAVAELLTSHGFGRIRDVAAEACRNRYFLGDDADLPISPLFRFVDAEVRKC